MSSPGSSSRASGLPRVSAMSRWVTSSAGASPRCTSSRARDASGLEAGQDQLGERPAGRSVAQAPSRAANTMATRSAPSRRAQNSSAPARGGVQPVRVVDDAQHEVLLGRGRQQRQGRDAHQERLHRRPVVLAERHPQRSRLRSRELVAQPRQRAQQPMQRRERQRRLDLEPLGAQHGRLPGLRRRARRAGPTCPHPARRAPPRCRPIRAAPPRRARPGVPARAHGRPARVERTRSRDPPIAVETWRFDRGDGDRAARLRAVRPRIRPARRRHPGGTAMHDPAPTAHDLDDPGPRAGQRRQIGLLALRRGRGAGRRRSLGGALHTGPSSTPRTAGTPSASRPTVRPSSAPRPSCSARTTRSTTPRHWTC